MTKIKSKLKNQIIGTIDEGPQFEADSKQVHQLIVSSTTGELSEEWIKSNNKKKNGCLDMKALRAHYQDKGNQSRRIGEAKRLKNTVGIWFLLNHE